MKTKKKFKIGDSVSVINDTMTGKIVAIAGEKISIECQDGFLYSFDSKELVASKAWNPLILPNMKEDKTAASGVPKTRFKSKKRTMVKEVDLHIHELIDSEKGMSNYDKLSLQLKTVQRELELAIAKRQQKIIFIHGRGEGVLKKELRILCSKYPVEYHDASYTEYGMGATEVIIFQNKK